MNSNESLNISTEQIQFFAPAAREVLRLLPDGRFLWYPPSGETIEITDAPLLTIALMDVVQQLCNLPRDLSATVPPELWARYLALQEEGGVNV